MNDLFTTRPSPNNISIIRGDERKHYWWTFTDDDDDDDDDDEDDNDFWKQT